MYDPYIDRIEPYFVSKCMHIRMNSIVYAMKLIFNDIHRIHLSSNPSRSFLGNVINDVIDDTDFVFSPPMVEEINALLSNIETKVTWSVSYSTIKIT